jgi:hypothetical protein
MRPAVLRRIAETGEAPELWALDPSELDRSTREHRVLENWLIETVQRSGLEPLDPAGPPFFDVAWKVHDRMVICEVKTVRLHQDQQLRLGLGQILDYVDQVRRGNDSTIGVVGAVLASGEPNEPRWVDVFRAAGIVLFSPDSPVDRFKEVGLVPHGGDDIG